MIVRLAIIAAALVAAAWWATSPSRFGADDLPEHAADPVAGERLFWAGGCASCHASGDSKELLGGGMDLESPYGTFVVPNISPHEQDGIGAWSPLDFVNAMQRGVAPDGRHYYPSFPYTSYARMSISDVLDLKAYLDTLPAVAGSASDHKLGFPWSIRRGLGAWKRLYLDDQPVVASEAATDSLVARGRDLVEGAGHCGECHTPRNIIGGLRAGRWLAGAPNPDGKGRVPNITPSGDGLADWSASDIEYYLESGFTPDFDTAGGTMVAVQENMAKLSDEDRRAIAAYLKSVPAVE